MSLTHEISTMKDLGLTSSQARIYLTLVDSGPSKAEEISKDSGITRQDIYRIMPTLQALGLVETTLSRPTVFKALPLQEALSTLINRRELEIAELKEHTSAILENHRNKTSKKLDGDFQTIFVPGKQTLLHRVQRAVGKAKKSVCAVSSWKSTREHIAQITKKSEYKRMLMEGIKIGFITERPNKRKNLSKSTKTLISHKPPNVEVRLVQDPPQAHLLIIDQKEVFIRTSTIEGFGESSAIWSNNPCIVAISRGYFDDLWKKSVDYQLTA
ncbi:TrmB family transcriptional regulator [Candidatus Bathyarchaeota archaeon]|nr:TrmB family transcriptional regulator [Candidatus Bathyarchaeota archaeon]